MTEKPDNTEEAVAWKGFTMAAFEAAKVPIGTPLFPLSSLETRDARIAVTALSVVAYASVGVRPDGVEHFIFKTSDGHIREQYRHISDHAPYWHFGFRKEFGQPPSYALALRSATVTA